MSAPETAAFLGLAKPTLIAGLLGAAAGSILGPGPWWQRLTRGGVGTITAYAGHHVTAMILCGLVDMVLDAPWVPSIAEMEPVAAFLVGLVGMVVCQAAINAATAARDKADDFVEHRMGRD